jgi:RNA recognition motif-containing protein
MEAVMAKKLYVGNLSPNVDEGMLTDWFSAHGKVESAKIITDRETSQSRGYGFVEMATDEEAKAAVEALNGSEQAGSTIKVAEANPPKMRPQRGGGGRSRFGGGGGGSSGGGGGGGGGRPRY